VINSQQSWSWITFIRFNLGWTVMDPTQIQLCFPVRVSRIITTITRRKQLRSFQFSWTLLKVAHVARRRGHRLLFQTSFDSRHCCYRPRWKSKSLPFTPGECVRTQPWKAVYVSWQQPAVVMSGATVLLIDCRTSDYEIKWSAVGILIDDGLSDYLVTAESNTMIATDFRKATSYDFISNVARSSAVAG